MTMPRFASLLLSLALVALYATAPARAQSPPAPSPAARTSPDDRRFLQIFIEDAAVVENAWVEAQFRYQNGAGDNDVTRLGPVLAFSPVDRLEIGGRIDLLDSDFGGDSESGLSDATVYGKWQFFRNPVQFAVGGELFLPTGDKEKLLGTGEVDVAVFASVRKDLQQATLTGFFGFRSNSDSTVGADLGPAVQLEGKTSTFLGGGVLFPVAAKFSLSGELQVETERYEQADSIIELTAGAYWFASPGFTLRGGLGLGLDDGAPDWEFIAGAAWHF